MALRPFNQGILIDKFNLHPGGVCNGLVVEYCRHMMSAKTRGIQGDFIAELRRKSNGSVESGRDFSKRVADYQLFQTHLFEAAKPEWVYLDDLENHLDRYETVGIGIHTLNGNGHIVAFSRVMENNRLKEYRIYDPNIGEINFNAQELGARDKALEALHKVISRTSEFLGGGATIISVSDVSGVVEHKNFLNDSQPNRYSGYIECFALIATAAAAAILLGVGAFYIARQNRYGAFMCGAAQLTTSAATWGVFHKTSYVISYVDNVLPQAIYAKYKELFSDNQQSDIALNV